MKRPTKQETKIVARVEAEMEKPRFAESVRKEPGVGEKKVVRVKRVGG